MHGCKNVVHRVFFNPITWDACCSSLEEKVPLFSLQPLSSVGLWMESSAPLQFGVHHSPQACPKLPKESIFSIRDNGCR
jgi:hypothetical protein